MTDEPYILVLYYSRHGHTRTLAGAIAQGIRAAGLQARIRSVPVLRDSGQSPASDRDLTCTLEDVEHCSGLALGSPTRFGHMAAAVQSFVESWSPLWLKGSLIDKPAVLFTSSQSAHGGQESTLLGMLPVLLHQGMLLLGLPYSEPPLQHSLQGGSPYGAGHIAQTGSTGLHRDERALAEALGRRLGRTALALRR